METIKHAACLMGSHARCPGERADDGSGTVYDAVNRSYIGKACGCACHNSTSPVDGGKGIAHE